MQKNIRRAFGWSGIECSFTSRSRKIKNEIIPSLKDMNIEVFGVMPKSPLLRSVTVGELVRRLDAQVICCPEKDQLLVET